MSHGNSCLLILNQKIRKTKHEEKALFHRVPCPLAIIFVLIVKVLGMSSPQYHTKIVQVFCRTKQIQKPSKTEEKVRESIIKS